LRSCRQTLRFRRKALLALGSRVFFARDVSHQFASHFIVSHPVVAQAWPKHPRTRGAASDHPNLGSVIGATERLFHPPLIVVANQGRLRRRGGDDNQLIRSQNQGVRATLAIRRKPLCPLGFRLSLVRITYGRFSSSRGPNADQTTRSLTYEIQYGRVCSHSALPYA
jgi:hypothetical protein